MEVLFITYAIITLGLFFVAGKVTLSIGDKRLSDNQVAIYCLSLWPLVLLIILILLVAALLSKSLSKFLMEREAK